MENDVKEELEKITRRLDDLKKQVDVLNADREIFESIQGRLTGLEEQWKLTRQHDAEATKDIKEEIGIANDRVVAKVETQIEGIRATVKNGKTNKKPWWKWGR